MVYNINFFLDKKILLRFFFFCKKVFFLEKFDFLIDCEIG